MYNFVVTGAIIIIVVYAIMMGLKFYSRYKNRKKRYDAFNSLLKQAQDIANKKKEAEKNK